MKNEKDGLRFVLQKKTSHYAMWMDVDECKYVFNMDAALSLAKDLKLLKKTDSFRIIERKDIVVWRSL